MCVSVWVSRQSKHCCCGWPECETADGMGPSAVWRPHIPVALVSKRDEWELRRATTQRRLSHTRRRRRVIRRDGMCKRQRCDTSRRRRSPLAAATPGGAQWLVVAGTSEPSNASPRPMHCPPRRPRLGASKSVAFQGWSVQGLRLRSGTAATAAATAGRMDCNLLGTGSGLCARRVPSRRASRGWQRGVGRHSHTHTAHAHGSNRGGWGRCQASNADE